MKKTLVLIAFLSFLLAAWSSTARAQGGFQSLTGDALAKAIPDHFDLEKSHIPVQKANSIALKNGKGAQVVLGLLDTTGSTPHIRQKYSGMVITDAKISICGITMAAGSYGFGLWAPRPPSKENGRFTLYNKDGDAIGECPAVRDETIKEAKPLAVITAKDGTTKLTLLKYAVDIQ